MAASACRFSRPDGKAVAVVFRRNAVLRLVAVRGLCREERGKLRRGGARAGREEEEQSIIFFCVVGKEKNRAVENPFFLFPSDASCSSKEGRRHGHRPRHATLGPRGQSDVGGPAGVSHWRAEPDRGRRAAGAVDWKLSSFFSFVIERSQTPLASSLSQRELSHPLLSLFLETLRNTAAPSPSSPAASPRPSATRSSRGAPGPRAGGRRSGGRAPPPPPRAEEEQEEGGSPALRAAPRRLPRRPRPKPSLTPGSTSAATTATAASTLFASPCPSAWGCRP